MFVDVSIFYIKRNNSVLLRILEQWHKQINISVMYTAVTLSRAVHFWGQPGK